MTRDLDFVRLSPTSGEQPWNPFGLAPDAHEGFRSNWWGRPIQRGGDRVESRFFVLRDVNSKQAARLELDWDFPSGVYPTADAALVRPVLEVQFIEVHRDFRCRGVGTLMVARVQAAFPDRQLIAESEQADGFWESLGWSRHLHVQDDGSTPSPRPLYLAP